MTQPNDRDPIALVHVEADVMIRAASAGDLGLLATWNSAVDRVVAPTLERQHRGEALVLLATLGPWPCGHLLVDFTKRAADDAVALWHMAVLGIVQNKGIGSRLIATAENEALRRRLRFVELGVEKINTDALRLYQRLGYEIVGQNDEVWPETDDDGTLHDVAHPCWEMRKALVTAEGIRIGPTDQERSAQPPEPTDWGASPSWCPRPGQARELIDAIRTDYALDWTGDPVDIGGSSSLNLHLSGRGDRHGHVIRVHRKWVTPARLDAIQSVRALLARRGLPFIEPLQAKSGSRWIEVGGHLAEVERHVEGEDMDRSHTLMIGMTVLARVHSELGRISLGPAANIAPTANHVDARVARLATARAAAIIKSWARSEADAAVARSAELLAEELWRAEAPFVDRVGRQLVHGDFWDNNVKFSGDDVAGILDLDFMGERPRIDDLALTLYYARASLLGTHGEAGVFQAMVELVGAYASAANPRLDPAELRALPCAIARSALHFTRHLALRTNEREQREVVAAASEDLDWALAIVRNAGRWQEAFQTFGAHQ